MVKPAFYLLCRKYFFTDIRLLAVIVLSIVFFTSCSISKPTYIFKDIKKDMVIQGVTDTSAALTIKKNDILSLGISSLNPLEDQLFNVTTGAASGKTEGVAAGYLVSSDGNIYLHKLGTLMVAGMTRKELKIKLENELLPYLKDPIVNVSFTNHFITIMGEAGSSQKLNMPAEKISLIDAIALSGHVSSSGSLKDVMVIRETPVGREFKHLNLENASIFTSPWYYLQPNDILVVNPDTDKVYKELRRTRNLQLYTTFVSVLSITIIILDRIIKK